MPFRFTPETVFLCRKSSYYLGSCANVVQIEKSKTLTILLIDC